MTWPPKITSKILNFRYNIFDYAVHRIWYYALEQQDIGKQTQSNVNEYMTSKWSSQRDLSPCDSLHPDNSSSFILFTIWRCRGWMANTCTSPHECTDGMRKLFVYQRLELLWGKATGLPSDGRKQDVEHLQCRAAARDALHMRTFKMQLITRRRVLNWTHWNRIRTRHCRPMKADIDPL